MEDRLRMESQRFSFVNCGDGMPMEASFLRASPQANENGYCESGCP
jgi:hypothetical protein